MIILVLVLQMKTNKKNYINIISENEWRIKDLEIQNANLLNENNKLKEKISI